VGTAFYARNHYTLQKDFTQALYFLNGDLQGSIIEQNKTAKAFDSFLLDPSAPNIDVEVKNVTIEDLRSAPYKARIEFYKIYSNPMDHSELSGSSGPQTSSTPSGSGSRTKCCW